MANNKDRDIAIVGMSCYFPGATTIEEFWNNLVNGVSSITDVPKERIDPNFFMDGKAGDPDHFYFNKGGFVTPINIDPLEYGILPIAAKGIDPDHLVALHLAKQALIDAGVFEKNISLQKGCFIIGKGNYSGVSSFRVGGYTFLTLLFENVIKYIFPGVDENKLLTIRKEFQEELGRYQADTAAGTMPNMVVALISNKFNLKGPAYTLDAACASSLLAVEHASDLLLSGQCDIALAGGMHLGQGSAFWSVFNVIGASSFRGEMAPFSENADGLLIGEGAGIIVLKKLDKAIADNDRIYAVIKACGSGSDGSDVSVMAPSTKGQIATLKLTWEKSGMDPKKIGYVETHGTATQAGDRAEMNTLIEFFGDNTAPSALLGSVKSNIGHAMPAAGMAGLIKTVLSLYHKKIPPTLHCEKPLKAMYDSRFMPVQQLIDWDEKKYPLVAAVNAFGFGGANTHIILEPYIKPEYTTPSNENFQLTASKPTADNLFNKKLTGKIEKSDKIKTPKMLIPIDFTTEPVKEFPTLRKVVNELIEKNSAATATKIDISGEDFNDAVLKEVNNNLLEIASIQKNIMEQFHSETSGQMIQNTQIGKTPDQVNEVNLFNKNNTIEKNIRFSLDDYPFLLDHTIVHQPNNRPMEELNPVVPFAMTIETLCENTQELIPGKKVLSVSSAGVQKWIPVKVPFISTMIGHRKTDNCISWKLPGFAYGDIALGDTFPVAPEDHTKEIDLGDNILPMNPNKSRIYSYFLFHGPRYQSINELVKVSKKGLYARINKAEGKGSLLDNLGQLLGVYCHLALDKNTITFPMSVDEILFYQDYRDQKGIFDYHLLVKEIKDYEVTSNVVIKRDGKIWCVVNGWHNRRLDYNREAMNIVMRPKQSILAKRLNNNIFYSFYDTGMKISVMDFLYERFLNSEERKHYRSLYPNQARDYLISRIALKDGVRKYIQKDENEDMIYPIEVSVRYDEHGKPHLYGHEKLKGIEVSIAHKGSEAVVIISDKPVGIDIEKIESRTDGFIENAFTSYEIELLKSKGNNPEWITRFWVAKEAYGKMLGVGLQGNPKQYEIESIDEEKIQINNRIINTVKHRNYFIIGWIQ